MCDDENNVEKNLCMTKTEICWKPFSGKKQKREWNPIIFYCVALYTPTPFIVVRCAIVQWICSHANLHTNFIKWIWDRTKKSSQQNHIYRNRSAKMWFIAYSMANDCAVVAAFSICDTFDINLCHYHTKASGELIAVAVS